MLTCWDEFWPQIAFILLDCGSYPFTITVDSVSLATGVLTDPKLYSGEFCTALRWCFKPVCLNVFGMSEENECEVTNLMI